MCDWSEDVEIIHTRRAIRSATTTVTSSGTVGRISTHSVRGVCTPSLSGHHIMLFKTNIAQVIASSFTVTAFISMGEGSFNTRKHA